MSGVTMPRIIFLDTNKWIELARGHYDKVPELKIVSQTVTATSKSGNAILPISVAQLEETIKNSNPARRKRLAEFMLLVSKGWTILPAPRIMSFEIEDACRRFLGLPRLDLQALAIKKGVSQLLGAKGRLVYKKPEARLPKDIEKQILDAVESPSTLLRSMTDWADERVSRESEQYSIEYARKIEALRKKQSRLMKPEQRHNAEFAKLLRDMIPEIILFFYGVGRDPRPFLEDILTDENSIIHFLHTVPTSFCNVELSFYRDEQMQRKVQPNDLNDIMMLSIAIPYTDAVVTERMWYRAITQNKLDRLRPTRAFSKLRDLDAWLKEELN